MNDKLGTFYNYLSYKYLSISEYLSLLYKNQNDC